MESSGGSAEQSKDDLISNFCDITGVEAERGQFYLESTNWNLQLAIQSFFEHSAEDTPMVTEPAVNPPNVTEDQQRAQQLQQMFGNQPMTGNNSSDDDSSQEMSSPKASNKKPKEVSKRQTSSKFATLDSLKRQTDSNSSEEEGQAFYAGGSERSGQQVLGPKKKNTDELVSQMFASAKEHGAQVVDPSEDTKAKKRINTFVGTGFKLGSTAEPSAPVVPTSSTQRPSTRDVTLRFWRNGFTLDDGPLRDFSDPENVEFLNSVGRGEIPRELITKYQGIEVHVNMEDKKHEDYVPPKRHVQAFAGEGFRLGNPTAEVVSSSPQTNVDPKVSEAEALKRLNVDESQPTTNIQIRLSDGSRLAVRLNLSNTIADIRQFICNSRPIYTTQPFLLMTTFPNKELTDESLTLKDAKLLNALIVQKLK